MAIPENLVLWELLSIIQSAFREANEIVSDEGGIEWFSEWAGDSHLVAALEEARSNVHLSALEDEREQLNSVSDRTIRDVTESRFPLYYEAAELLQKYRRLKNHEIDDAEAKSLLSQRLFAPRTGEDWAEDEVPTFFELYWIFKILGKYEAAERNLITLGTHSIAAWSDGNMSYELYHDWTGRNEFAFGEPYFDRERDGSLPGEDRYLGRTAELLSVQETESMEVFGYRRPKERSRRPDFVLLRREEGEVIDIAIGEVKYTRRESTAADGLEQLYRYLIFARQTDTPKPSYLTTQPDHFATPTVHGFLCVDEVDTHRDPAGNISILSVGDEFDPPF